MNFVEELNKRHLVLDGSMGALLQSRGLPAGMAPDVWMLENKEIILNAHKEYANAGADILLTNTFGASKWRLDEYQAYKDIEKINACAVEIARKAGGDRCFIAGDLGPSGETVFPTGKKSFEEVCEIFYEQARILVNLGVDLIAIETMFDSLEFRAALSAVRAASSTIPIVAHATFNTDGITDTGATPENIVAIAAGFHTTAVGLNCSTGPEAMVSVVERMAKISPIPVSVQPNAGLPVVRDGATRFPLTASDMQPFVEQFLDKGARIIGGCCGTTPEYIRGVKKAVMNRQLKVPAVEHSVLISSLSGLARLGGDQGFLPIGERMNPSGRKKLSEDLKKGNLQQLLEDAELQFRAGGKVFDLNVGVPMVDEPRLMREAVVGVQNRYPSIPLMIDSANSHALDTGASVYYGRPLLNSLNAEIEKLDEVIPIVQKHGAVAVALLTGVDVPVSAIERMKNADKITERLFAAGIREEDIVFDCLGLVVSAMQDGSKATLDTIAFVKERFPKAATTLGLSNTSFGLPNRNFVHSAFLATAITRGLDSAIMSVTDKMAVTLAGAAGMWGPKSASINYFIQNFSEKVELQGKTEATTGTSVKATKVGSAEPKFVESLSDNEKLIFRSIVDGDKETTVRCVKEFIAKNETKAMSLFIEVMTPAIRRLGDLFAERVKFIPHLIAAADAMKAGVEILEPYLIAAREKSGEKRGCIVFATVKGDIHDIGKNICILMLRNFGYDVIDLGRNVEAELILQTAIEKKAQVVALSALMTTTMMQMKVVIDAVRSRNLPFKVVIGGAVVTPEFAREIHADGFSTDVGTVVSEMERVLEILKLVDQK